MSERRINWYRVVSWILMLAATVGFCWFLWEVATGGKL